MPIYIGTMKAYTRPEIAQLAGIHLRTLHRWLKRGVISEPKRAKIGGLAVRLWSERDLKRVRDYKLNFYAKGRGRKKRPEK